MKLLFGQNLSRKLVQMLADVFPDSAHVLLLGLEKSEDSDIWGFAAENEYVIVSKDKDFYQRSVVAGHPPKVIHLRIGNCSAADISTAMRDEAGQIREFLSNLSKSYLVLPRE